MGCFVTKFEETVLGNNADESERKFQFGYRKLTCEPNVSRVLPLQCTKQGRAVPWVTNKMADSNVNSKFALWFDIPRFGHG